MLKQRIVAAIQKSSSILRLKSSKQAALVDFIACAPSTVTMTASAPVVKKGFLENGMIDKNTNSIPDMYSVLRTIGRPLLVDEYQLIVDSFPTLYRTVLEKGFVPEQVFDDLGFAQDVDMFGNERVLNATISQENQQRAKILSHQQQRQLRLERMQEIRTKENVRLELIKTKKEAILRESRRCEEEVKKVSATTHIEDALIKDFADRSVRVPWLRAFVHVRSTATLQYPCSLPKVKKSDHC
jgi:hypothetical protein